ncbi:MAG: DNA double-strand break repair nuclease NurA [Anaerolineales bacterium]
MSLDLPSLTPQLTQAGRTAAKQLSRLTKLLPQVEAALEAVAQMDREALALRLQRAGTRWSGAAPTSEDPAAAFPVPDFEDRYRLVAADGSQVYPDRHGAALYYLINIGSLQMQPGSGRAPTTRSQPELFHSPDDLYDETGSILGAEYINGERDVAEMAELARLAAKEQPGDCLALLDNGLMLWLMLQVRDQPRARAEDLISEYLEQMSRLQGAGAALAGIIDRPRHGNVLALAHLGELPQNSINDSTLRANPYRGLSDAALFLRHLKVGERSAAFKYASPVNERFEEEGHQILFFYLRTAEEVLLRVEIPQWVFHSSQLLKLVHAGIMDDSRSSGGYPYCLARAHELAVVTSQERQQLDQMMATSLARHGLTPRASTKATTKTWLGGRRSHRL